MSDNITIRTNNKNHTINCLVVHDERWYRAKDITTALLYNDTNKQYNFTLASTKKED